MFERACVFFQSNKTLLRRVLQLFFYTFLPSSSKQQTTTTSKQTNKHHDFTAAASCSLLVLASVASNGPGCIGLPAVLVLLHPPENNNHLSSGYDLLKYEHFTSSHNGRTDGPTRTPEFHSANWEPGVLGGGRVLWHKRKRVRYWRRGRKARELPESGVLGCCCGRKRSWSWSCSLSLAACLCLFALPSS